VTANEAITIGGIEVRPGQQRVIELPIADLYTGTSLSMPVHVICGRRAGPVLFVTAAIHGDELNGVEIVRRLLKRKALKSLRGSLLAVPVVNVHGFLLQSRYLPDRRDLNRSFPGSAKGSVAARMANVLVRKVVSEADFGIDLHTGAINRANLPQIRADLDDEKTRELATAFGVPVVVDAEARDGSLRGCAQELGLPTLTYEAGEALRFDELCIRAGLRGIVRVMRHIGMLPDGRKPSRARPVVANSTSWVRAPASGIVSRDVDLGSRVVTGQRLATIGDPLGDHEDPVIAPFDGIVIGRNSLPLAHEGDALFNVAGFDSVARAEDRLEEFAAEYGS